MRDALPLAFVPSPEAAAASRMADFASYCSRRAGLPLQDWTSLSTWSAQAYEQFWPTLLDYLDPLREGASLPVCTDTAVESAIFFPGLRLNYAENLLRAPAGEPVDKIVLTALDEAGGRADYTRAQLRRQSFGLGQALRELGMKVGSRICALARNDASAIVACLGSASIGACWSSVSPDLGPDSILTRFGPLEPELLFANTHLRLQGQKRSTGVLVRQLLERIPSIRVLVLLDDDALDFEPTLPVLRLSALIAKPPLERVVRVPFNQPLFVLFSSGTTGAPKCIVHGHGGTLLEHLKELVLHTALTPQDTICFVTSTGWMMWNWLISGLATGARVVVYDGSVSYPEPDSLLQALAADGVTVFGTSPAYLRFLQDSEIVPRERFAWPTLRAMLSTGSILYDDQYDFVERAFGRLPLQSISGGSDIIGCFVLGNPMLPVHRGEAQCVSLGLDVRARDGEQNLTQGTGELVCAKPFPSRPVGLHADPGGDRFHNAYFAQNDGVWTHGDLIELTERGGARILGRSDGVLNIRGIRIGPAEIYGIVGRIEQVVESMAVDQEDVTVPGGRKLVLLVVLKPGITLDKPLTFAIKRELKSKAGMTHVPDLILQVEQLPQTHNGKRSERAVQDLLNGRCPRNLSAIKNPEALSALLAFPELNIAPKLLA
ncbi:acetoacetate--CoA ligase [Panacagrimonas sp.]|uniref:acetoacetate--CoA ligase n=1 Tax=Panacagrimonas sp. TaxID=2480088 RepID=UPI003B527342